MAGCMPEYLHMHTKGVLSEYQHPERLRSFPPVVSIVRQNLRCYNRNPWHTNCLHGLFRCQILQSPPYSIRESWAILLHAVEANAHSAPK
jgi:hypothetical protein